MLLRVNIKPNGWQWSRVIPVRTDNLRCQVTDLRPNGAPHGVPHGIVPRLRLTAGAYGVD